MSFEDFAKRKPWPEPSLMLTEPELDELCEKQLFGRASLQDFARAIERITAQRIVTRLEAACGATSLPPVVIKHLFLERAK